MCLLILKPAGKTVPTSFLENAAIRNPDGCGVAYVSDGKVQIAKSSRWTADEIDKVLTRAGDSPAIVHFRYATQGSTSGVNTHPFKLNDYWAAAHNGTIPNVEMQEDESDTRAFLRKNVIPLLATNVRLDDKNILTMLGQAMGRGNKMAFLCGDGSYGIANESSGHWKDGVWYSNYTYRKYTPPPVAPRLKYNHDYHRRAHYYAQGDDFYFRHGHKSSRPVIIDDDDEDDFCCGEDSWHEYNKNDLTCHECSCFIRDDFFINPRHGFCLCYGCYQKVK